MDFSLTKLMIEKLSQVIVGKRQAIELLLVALLADGHALIEDVPGVGKTLMAKSLAKAMGGTFKRVQFTPDLLGFFPREKTTASDISVTVYPRLVPLKAFSLPRRDLFGVPGAKSPVQDPVYILGTRDYQHRRPARLKSWFRQPSG